MAKMPLEGSLKGGLRLKRWLIGLLIFLLASLFAINSFTIGQFRIIPFGSSANQVNYIELKNPQEATTPTTTTTTFAPLPPNGYVVSNRGCQIPDLSPTEPEVMRYFDKASPIICDHGTHLPLVDSNNSAIFVNPEARAHFYNETEPIDCCWRSFWRADNSDNEVSISNDCHPFEESATMSSEFVQVECHYHNDSVYKDYFSFVPRKLQVEERCRKQLRAEQFASPGSPPPRKLSILVVGIDAVSRLNLHRMMPLTVRQLQKLDAVEMLGYNKVADNTYPNLVPVLSGLSEARFEKLCWRIHSKPFDRCPLIWKNFGAAGYRTILGEDACLMTTFNYLKPGFRVQPTDYYRRPFCVAAESDIGNAHKLNADLCLGTRLNFDDLLHYTRKVAEEFVDDPYFAFFWQASLTHDFIEFPALGDESYRAFFEYLSNNELLRNTAVIFMSDHGMRWGSFRQTYQGRLEDSLPFVFFIFPDWWKNQYPAAWNQLRRNTRSLTTPFDLHETLRDILDPKRLDDKTNSNNIIKEERDKHPHYGISMFKPIPESRNCETAGIPEHWCMCHSRRNVSLDDPLLGKVVNFLMFEINGMLAKYPQCAQLEPLQLIDAKVLSDDQPVTKKNEEGAPWIEYTVTVETAPSRAIFEGSMRYRTDNEKMSLVGSISRLNAYGNQSACVSDFHMRLYCYCH